MSNHYNRRLGTDRLNQSVKNIFKPGVLLIAAGCSIALPLLNAGENELGELKTLVAAYKKERSLSSRKDVVAFYIKSIGDQLKKCSDCDKEAKNEALQSLILLTQIQSDWDACIGLLQQQLELDLSPVKKFRTAAKLANVMSVKVHIEGASVEKSRLIVLACREAELLFEKANSATLSELGEVRVMGGQKVFVVPDLADLTGPSIEVLKMHSHWAAKAGDYVDAYDVDQKLIKLMGLQISPKGLDSIYSNAISNAASANIGLPSVQLLIQLIGSSLSETVKISQIQRLSEYVVTDPAVLEVIKSKEPLVNLGDVVIFEFWKSAIQRLNQEGKYAQCIDLLDLLLTKAGASSKSLVLSSTDPQASTKIILYRLLASTYSKSGNVMAAKAINDYLNNFLNTDKPSSTKK